MSATDEKSPKGIARRARLDSGRSRGASRGLAANVNALEKGKYDPSLPLAFKIAHVFSEPIEAIFIHETEVN